MVLEPLPSRVDDLIEVGDLWLPAEFVLCPVRRCDQYRRVAGTAVASFDWNFLSCDPPGGIDHFADRKLAAGTEVVAASVAGLNCVDGQNVCFAQIFNVNIVANAGAVFGRVIGAENSDAMAAAQCRLQGDWNEVGFRIVIFSQTAVQGGAGDVEIAKSYKTKLRVGDDCIPQNLLDEQLRGP